MVEKNSNVATQPTAPATNSSLVGVLVLSILVLASSIWLYRQSVIVAATPQDSPQEQRVVENDSSFNAQLFSLPNETLLGFVEIPAGLFLMGSDPQQDSMAYSNERWSTTEVQGRLDLPTFYIARYETTVAQFAQFVAATHYKTDQRTLQRTANFPVAYVTWPDALAYCRWLETSLHDSDKTPKAIKTLLDEQWHITLPSEAQWEKAARSTDGRVFPWGNTPVADFANIRSNGVKPVGSFSCPNCSYGIADMSGNVWELTRSPYTNYPFSETTTPAALNQDALFIMRGGSYSDDFNNARAAIRGGIDPGVRQANIGFRIALQPPKT